MLARLLLILSCVSLVQGQFYGYPGYAYPAYYPPAPVYYPPVYPAYPYPGYYYPRPYYNPVRSMLRGALMGATIGFWGGKK